MDTNEEMLRELIDRCRAIARSNRPSREMSLVITKLDEASLWLAAYAVVTEKGEKQ